MAISVILSPEKTFTFDPAGRFIRGSFGNRQLVRGLDGTIKEKSWLLHSTGPEREARVLSPLEAKKVIRTIYENLQDLRRLLDKKGVIRFQTSDRGKEAGFDSPKKILALLLHWNEKKVLADENLFHKIYRPLNILPPDQYFSVVIQMAEGCPWNRCAFCHFYKARSFRSKSLSEIKKHIRTVKNFLGEGIHLRKSVFLADANALKSPMNTLVKTMMEIRRQMPDQTGPDGGIFSFGDVPAILEKTPAEFRKLKNLGLKRVYIGLESGSAVVRRILNKPGSPEMAIQAARKLKKAGLKLGVIVLLADFGRHKFHHLKETAQVLKKMGLSAGDFLYFSPFIPAKGSALPPFEKDAMWRKTISSMTKSFAPPAQGPLIAVYDIREFVV